MSEIQERPLAEASLSELGKVIVRVNMTKGWNATMPSDWQHTYKIPGVLALIHSEVSEALEEFRVDNRAEFERELADIIIRTLDLAEGLGVDIGRVVAEKIEHNKGRPIRHGGKRV